MPLRTAIRTACLTTLLTALLAACPAAAQPAREGIPSPQDFFGFAMGAEKHLAGWDRMVEYFQLVDRMSDRVVVQELGKTTMGKPYIMEVVSAPETVKDLSRYQEMRV